jgi:hypothetical protein
MYIHPNDYSEGFDVLGIGFYIFFLFFGWEKVVVCRVLIEEDMDKGKK